MKVRAPQSKRTPVRLRHKIEKASAAKQRKQRKLAKKVRSPSPPPPSAGPADRGQNPQKRPKLKKDPGIPNLFPYKDRVLQEIEEKQRLKAEERQRQRDEHRAAQRGAVPAAEPEMAVDGPGADASDADSDVDADAVEGSQPEEAMEEDGPESANPMAALLESARARAGTYDARRAASLAPSAADSDDPTPAPARQGLDPSTRAYANLFPDLLARADVVLYVLDARDPQATRSPATERQIVAHGDGSTRCILVLNKIDLVPPAAAQAWLRRLRRSHPTLPLRAAPAAPQARTYAHGALTPAATAQALLRALKAHAARRDLRRALTVAVAGFPNVGKSSVVNALAARHGRGRAAAPAGAEAGVTTAVRTVRLDARLHLLDSPGVVFPAADAEGDVEMTSGKAGAAAAAAKLALLNALPPKALADPVAAVGLLLRRVAALPEAERHLLAFYGLPALVSGATPGDVTTDFLVQVARRRGRLGKGGVPNTDAAARSVLADWRDGRIGAWTLPPAEDEVGLQTAVVAEWGKEFAIEGLWGNEAGQDAGEGEEQMEE